LRLQLLVSSQAIILNAGFNMLVFLGTISCIA
jgi:hypothetical protein